MKTRKIIITLFSVLFIPVVSLWAQVPSRAEKLNAQRVAFITEKLQLTPDEAQRFWPVYNEYRSKRMKIEQEKTALFRKYSLSRENEITDEEARQVADEYVSLEKKQADLLVEYNARFQKVLPPRKVLKLYRAEKQFTAYLLRQIRDRQRREGPPPRKY
jgi:Spy/CpxP family protein refolding chaperone